MISILRKILILLWRIWFYVILIVPILILFPILLISVAKDSWYPFFFRLARFWARIILYGMGFWPKVERLEKTERGKSYMYIANHTSMTDIMLMLHSVRNPFVFVGKQELAKFPIFGYFYKQTCILVDRGDPKSRRAVFESAQKRLNQGLSICIFPEGGVPDDTSVVLDTFKDGAFRLAIDHQVPIVPMVFYDNKKRFSYDFFTGSPGVMRVKVLPFIETEGKDPNDRRDLRDEAYKAIHSELLKDKTTPQALKG
ncbi:lysophospholipid acyltransferase family protein [Leeuwenhoekiella nanhaiensis]|uniref:1-acyl-sn-glycerol-3-phosphate acyltransferase n=1 Tax=Leeuwenhoekiella nanhaiensis TaxID=1655491 RepID=A0A2G1VWK4_9FLAO|nr:lysophospholipid acyltransferase family protein [Leeuwenhoekiella nanhaiensis]PHQ30799.1 1-acyl-sn-glycerol-3-phosphate acyltransferase [Leeuwenhoekiella nanhaiensis]